MCEAQVKISWFVHLPRYLTNFYSSAAQDLWHQFGAARATSQTRANYLQHVKAEPAYYKSNGHGIPRQQKMKDASSRWTYHVRACCSKSTTDQLKALIKQASDYACWKLYKVSLSLSTIAGQQRQWLPKWGQVRPKIQNKVHSQHPSLYRRSYITKMIFEWKLLVGIMKSQLMR